MMTATTFWRKAAAMFGRHSEPMDAALPLSEGLPAKPVVALSIRTKGLLAFAALIVYSALIAVFAFHQKELLLRDFEGIQELLETESMLKEADVATFHAVMAVFANAESSDREASMERIRMHYDSLLQRQAALAPRLPGAYLNLADMKQAWADVRKEPSRANLNYMVAELVETKNELATLTEQVQSTRKAKSLAYRQQADRVAMTAFVLVMLGLGLLGAIIGLFFRRLAHDLRVLHVRALEIVNGYRGAALPVTRHDEVGHLIVAVNNMAETLDQHEKEEIVKRQKYFHQEKMAAIGALAAGVAHEIGNPIAAICGIAQDMIERRNQGNPSCGAQDCHDCRPDLIYAQAERLAAITREIAEFASPRAAEPQFMDLNGQLRTASSLIRYDKRLQNVSLSLDLDSQLPAIYGVADQVTQVVMNLLINAMDALEGVVGRVAEMSISTRVVGERACLAIEDNGCGMDAVTLARAFEAFYTTKAAGKGTGLGLSLCYAIIKKHGGSIEIDSKPGAGCKVTVFFPLNDTSYNEADPL
jgi:two-component system NtrC family sensor kinase